MMSPDGSSKPLPEEKLLRLIRGKGPKREAPQVQQALASAATLPRAMRPSATMVRWVPLAIGSLVALLVVELAALAVQLMRPVPVITLPDAAGRSELPPAEEMRRMPPMPSLAESAASELFAVPAAGSTAPAEGGDRPVRTGPSQGAQQLATKLTLMGIISGEPPQAIIEDSTTKKSFFVTIGQPVADGAVLEQVLDNRVILDLNGEKVELTL